MNILSRNKFTINHSTYLYVNAYELSNYLWSQTSCCIRDNEMFSFRYELSYVNPKYILQRNFCYSNCTCTVVLLCAYVYVLWDHLVCEMFSGNIYTYSYIPSVPFPRPRYSIWHVYNNFRWTILCYFFVFFFFFFFSYCSNNLLPLDPLLLSLLPYLTELFPKLQNLHLLWYLKTNLQLVASPMKALDFLPCYLFLMHSISESHEF